MQVIDQMQDAIEKKNSRAIVEEFSAMLRKLCDFLGRLRSA